MIVESPDYVKSRYKLHKLKEIEDLVANTVQVKSILSRAILWLSKSRTRMPTPNIMNLGLCKPLFGIVLREADCSNNCSLQMQRSGLK